MKSLLLLAAGAVVGVYGERAYRALHAPLGSLPPAAPGVSYHRAASAPAWAGEDR